MIACRRCIRFVSLLAVALGMVIVMAECRVGLAQPPRKPDVAQEQPVLYQEKSEELAATDPLVVQLQSDFTKALAGTTTTPPPADDPQKAAKVKQLVANAKTLIQAKRFADAEKVLVEARQLAPDDPDVQKAIQDFFRAKAIEVAQLVTNAETAIKGKRLTDAYTLLKQANALSPQDPDLQKAIQDYTRELVREAETAIKGKRLDEAKTLLTQANQLAPNDPAVQKAVNDYTQATGTQNTQQVQQFVREAEIAIKGKRLAEAKSLLKQAIQLAPNDPDVHTAICDYNQAYYQVTATQTTQQEQQLVRDAETAIKGKRLSDAITLLTQASQTGTE